jgi:predicted ATPase/DNA-binding CsgD family transcriptional regulator
VGHSAQIEEGRSVPWLSQKLDEGRYGEEVRRIEGMTTPSFQPNTARATVPGQPPTPATPLLGRASELVAVRDLLTRADVRLVSLVGPGGVGKTRLALASLASSADDFTEGACWVPLASLTETARVWPSVARALGVPDPPEGTAALEGLKRHLFARSVLLALDNLEHLIEIAPELVELLEACPQLKVLVTSRRALRVRSEHEYLVRPLEPPSITVSLEAVAQNDAAQLFVQRARAVRSDFSLSAENASTIAQICARLDGLPLALELAASRLRLFTADGLLERLSAPLDALVGGPRDASERQRSLRATLEWSLALLEPEERRLFARLGVFVGGFDLEAAEAIGGPDALKRLEVLVEQSLVQANDDRFFMLETIRESALEHLEQNGDATDAREAHARHFQALCERAEPEIWGANQTAWMDRLERELDNLRAAMGWGLEHDTALTLFVSGALYPLWNYRGRTHEALGWMERAIERGTTSDEVRAHALEEIAEYLYYVNRVEEARTHLSEALGLYRELKLERRIASSLSQLAKCEDTLGNHERARAHLEEALERARASGKADMIAQVTYALGLNRYGALNFAGAREVFEESLDQARTLGSPNALCARLMAIGIVDYALGDADSARDLLEQGLEIAREQHNISRVRNILSNLVIALADLNQLERARALLEELCDVNLQAGRGAMQTGLDDDWLLAAASVASKEGLHTRAAQLVGAAQRYHEADGLPWLETDRVQVARLAAASIRALGDDWERTVADGLELEVADILKAPEPAPRKRPDALSAREFEVISLVAEGLTDAEIAARLSIRPRTVSTHLTNVYNKFGVRSRTQAVREARKRRLLEIA